MVLDEKVPHLSKQSNFVKLIKIVYGLVNAIYTWHLHVKKGLLNCRFHQSKIDPCLFFKKEMLFILYVDDAVCLTLNKKTADELIQDLKGKGTN